MSEDMPDIEAVMSEYDALWQGDFSKTDVLASSVTVHSPSAGAIQSPEAVEAHIPGFYSGFSDIQITTHDLLTGEDLIMGEWTMSGTHEGEHHLGACEFLSTAESPPSLFGHEFHPFPEPFADWALHVWIWEDNPWGLFADFNPWVGCPE